ncbi:MAG: hypothetical protein ACKN9U_16355, partial [Pirellulaceae bacterium]
AVPHQEKQPPMMCVTPFGHQPASPPVLALPAACTPMKAELPVDRLTLSILAILSATGHR